VTVHTKDVAAWLGAFAVAIHAEKDELTRLDSAIGDGDHGANMDRGFQAVQAKLPELGQKDIGALLKGVGMTLVSTVGGASGPLYGTLFLQMGSSLGSRTEFDLPEWAAALKAGVDGVILRGKAAAGDKTMLDTLLPALGAIQEAGAQGCDLAEALRRAVAAGADGMRATIPLVARKGRASYLGERSAGHQDPGATSSQLLLEAALAAWVR